MIVVILGSGVMGSALAMPLADNGHEVRLVGTHLDREIIDAIRSSGVHPGLEVRTGSPGVNPRAGLAGSASLPGVGRGDIPVRGSSSMASPSMTANNPAIEISSL